MVILRISDKLSFENVTRSFLCLLFSKFNAAMFMLRNILTDNVFENILAWNDYMFNISSEKISLVVNLK